MFDLYTVLVFVTVFTLIISITDVICNRLVSHKNKREIITVCLLMGTALMCEWLGVETNGADPSLIWLHKAAKLAEFCVAPSIGATAAIAYGKVKNVKLVYFLLVCHAVFEVFAMMNGLVFTVDADNVYHREPLYWVYIAAFVSSVAYCFVCMVNGYKQYQAKFNVVMGLVICLLAAGVGIQIVCPEIRIDFICAAIGNLFLYNNRASIVNQVDKTTGLLNRRCFERSAENIKSNICVLVFDINKFKNINDTYGHTVGDECLRDVAKIMFATYGKHGSCYRIGGDEFCVMLHKNRDKVDRLNEILHNEAAKLRPKYGNLFGVSLGYAYCDGKNVLFGDALKKADEMMYKNKKSNKIL